ncbi:MAG: dienelactone hydrolase family protein [Acidimicrobiaceae bacterium]|nr:dienelactone hydrolase family protein [Acidimicrobiaceae bacterium]
MPDNARQNVTFPSNSHEAHGYLATPPSGRGPGVIVIQEWWGLTPHIADIADRLAAAGFVALAPDLYGGTVAHDADEAGRLMQQLPVEQASRDLSGAVDYLLGREDTTGDRVGAVGFCMGGGFVLTLALQRADHVGAAVAFYPVGHNPSDFSGLKAGVQVHFGADDAFFPTDQAEALSGAIRAAGTATEFHTYPAGHAFLNHENLLGTYDADHAKVAFDRAVEFLRRHLG